MHTETPPPLPWIHVPYATSAGTRPSRAMRRMRILIIVCLAASGLATSAVLVVGSASVALGSLVVVAVLAVKQHELIPPPLAEQPSALNLPSSNAATDVISQANTPTIPDVPIPNWVLDIAGISTTNTVQPASDATTNQATPPMQFSLTPGIDKVSFSAITSRAQSIDLLAGPRVPTSAITNLLARDYSGELVKPDPNPAEAALALVSMDKATRRAINAVIAVRGKRLDDSVIRNLPILLFAGGGGVNNPLVKVGLVCAVVIRSRDFLALGDLESMLADQMPKAACDQYRAILNQYWDEFAIEAARARDKRGEDLAPARLLIAEAKLQLLGEEGTRSFERVVRSGDVFYYYFTRHLNLQGEHAGKVRTLISDYAQIYGGDGTPVAKLTLRDAILPLLNRTQQRTFERNIKPFLD